MFDLRLKVSHRDLFFFDFVCFYTVKNGEGRGVGGCIHAQLGTCSTINVNYQIVFCWLSSQVGMKGNKKAPRAAKLAV